MKSGTKKSLRVIDFLCLFIIAVASAVHLTGFLSRNSLKIFLSVFVSLPIFLESIEGFKEKSRHFVIKGCITLAIAVTVAVLPILCK